MKNAEVSCVVRWMLRSRPHVKFALQHHFTVRLSFHETRACVCCTDWIISPARSAVSQFYIALFIHSVVFMRAGDRTWLRSLSFNIGIRHPTVIGFTVRRRALRSWFVFPPLEDGEWTFPDRRVTAVARSRRREKSRAILIQYLCHCGPAVNSQRTLNHVSLRV